MIDVLKQALEALEAITLSRHLEDARTIAKNARYGLRQVIEQAEKESILQKISDIGQEIDRPVKSYTGGVPQYAPPRKPWVGLTGEELAQLTIDNAGYPTRLTAAIEAKLKEKNT